MMKKIVLVFVLCISLIYVVRCVRIEKLYSKYNNELQVEVADIYNNADAIVTIVSDDGYFESAVNINEIFKKRGMRCSVAGAVTIVEDDLDSWKLLEKEGTIDLVSHSYNHIRMEEGTEIAEDREALLLEIVEADKWYEDEFSKEQIVFVCPENQMCEMGYEILQESNFYAVRRGARGYNSLSPKEGNEDGEWFNLKVQGICDPGVNTDVRNKWIDTAIDERSWLIEMWHNVMVQDDGMYQTISILDAEEHLDYIREKEKAGNIWVATLTDAVKYIREKQNIKIDAKIRNNRLYINTEYTDDKMQYSIFDHPLTLMITVPEEINVKPMKDSYIVDNNIMVNIIPGQDAVLKIELPKDAKLK